MKWARAVHHLEDLAERCAEMLDKPKTIFPLRVVQLWATGEILGDEHDFERVEVALVVELPVDEVPWLSDPAGTGQWANATRLAKNPIHAFWRSVRAPVWNHRIDRPALVWDAKDGFAEEAFAALKEAQGERVRLPAPGADELQARLDDELALSLRSLRAQTAAYEDKRWAPGKIEPAADALWRANAGYLDILDAQPRVYERADG
jgi:hypothetical protein